jgi:hypothetical protein
VKESPSDISRYPPAASASTYAMGDVGASAARLPTLRLRNIGGFRIPLQPTTAVLPAGRLALCGVSGSVGQLAQWRPLGSLHAAQRNTGQTA